MGANGGMGGTMGLTSGALGGAGDGGSKKPRFIVSVTISSSDVSGVYGGKEGGGGGGLGSTCRNGDRGGQMISRLM
jgi:hypothetical protein